ncbi:MAG: PBSX family phage terminase large subunit [Oscillospiraceae bacterium]|nr:PBSX family phage terminase large subunit [Oscillospiraceae bacterium]
MRFSPKQRQALLWWRERPELEGIICDGAVRSGKTLCMGIGFFCWAMGSFDGQCFVLCGKTIGALRRNVLWEVLPVLRQMGMGVLERRGENLLVLRSGGRENRFCLAGGKDEGSAALIQGATFAGALLDEAALMPRSFVEQTLARCSVEGAKLWFSCNPEGPGHWFYREWILKAAERRMLYLHFTMEDNPVLSPATREQYQRRYTGAFYRRFVLGEWTAPAGRIYDFYRREDHARPKPQGAAERWCVSVDYGTANPCSMGLWGKYGTAWYRVEEVYYASRETGVQRTDQEYVEMLKNLTGGRRIEQVVADPSAVSFITALRREGFHVVGAVNDVLSGIRVTAGLLKSGRLVICESCEDCLRELEGYCWESPEGGREAPRKENDHAMDDMRYFAATIAGREEGASGVGAVAVARGRC